MNMNFFLYGYYGFGNLGDDLLLRALIENITLYCESKFWVRSLNKGPSLGNNVIYTEVDKVICDTKLNKVYRLLNYFREVLFYIKESDCIIIGGGTLIHDSKSRWSLLIIFFIVVFSKLLRKQVVFIGIGIAALKYKSSYVILNLITKLSAEFCVRDIEAEKILLKAKVSKKSFKVTADLAYSLTVLHEKLNKVKNNGNNGISIGITIVDNILNNNKMQQVIIEYISLLKGMNLKFKVHLIPFHTMCTDYKYSINDINVMRKIKNEILLENIIIEENIGENFSLIYKELDLVIGMRFHSLVLAEMYEIPFVGILHDNKIKGICKSYNMPFIDIKDITAEMLIIMSQNALKKKFPTNVNLDMVKKAKKNFDFLNKLCGRSKG